MTIELPWEYWEEVTLRGYYRTSLSRQFEHALLLENP